jgi:hypothetical protein
MELKTMLSQDASDLCNLFHISFRNHKQHPTPHGLRCFIGNIDLAVAVISHLRDELSVLRAEAVRMLEGIEAEDAAVAEFNKRIPA